MALTGNIPLTVEFSDSSTGDNLTYVWDFGDGQTSTEQNPTHEYTVAGDYTVSLTATNTYGSDITTNIVSATSTGGGGDDLPPPPPPGGPPGGKGPNGKGGKGGPPGK